jgi:hypothetical protein
MATSFQRFQALKDILSDDAALDELTTGEIISAQKEIRAYSAQIKAENNKLRQQGFSDAQIAEIDAARRTAPDPDSKEAAKAIPGMPFSGAISPRAISGVVEGGVRAVEGVIDLGQSVATAIRAETPEDMAASKQQVMDRRTANITQNLADFGQLPSGVHHTIGEVAPYLLAMPEAAATYTGLLLKRVIQGGVQAAATFKPEEEDIMDRAFETAIGAGIGVLSAFGDAPQGAAQHVAGNMTRNFNRHAQHADDIAEEVNRMTGRADFGFTTAEAGGGKFALGLEQRSGGRATKDFQNRQMDTLGSHIINRSRALWSRPGEVSPGLVARDLRVTLGNVDDMLKAKSQREWNEGFQLLKAQYGDDVLVNGETFLHKIDELMAEEANLLTNVGQKPSQALKRYRREVDKHVNPIEARQNELGLWQPYDRKSDAWVPIQGTTDKKVVDVYALDTNRELREAGMAGLDIETTQDLMKGLNGLIGGRTKMLKDGTENANADQGRALMGALTSSLEAKGSNQAAVQAVQMVRGDYARTMAKRQAISDLLVNEIFGGKSPATNPTAALKDLLDQDETALQMTREFLDRWNPDLLNDLRAVHLTNIKNAAIKSDQPAVDTAENLNKLADALQNNFSFELGGVGRGLFSVADQKDLVTTAEALRVMANKYSTGIAAGGAAAGFIEDMTINAVSRSAEFMARFIARNTVASGNMESALLNQSYRKALQTFANAPVGSKTSKRAMVVLTEFGTHMIEQREARDRMEARQAEAERIQSGAMTIQ